MKSIIKLAIIAILGLTITTCGDYGDYGETITSPIVISNTEHHVGDNEGAEGLALSADFEMPSSFTYAEISVTFPFPNSFGTSGFTSDTPPEIQINGTKVGMWASQLTQYPQCIDEYSDFVCPITVSYEITNLVSGGNNTFTIKSIGFYDNADDFAFSDVTVTFE